MSTAGKDLCDCGKVAVWCYMPGHGEGNPNYCDDCVRRGCECNHYSTKADDYYPPGDVDAVGIHPTEEDEPIKWIDEHTWTKLDEKGREYPCCEYMYSEDGWDKEEHEE